MIFLVFCIVLTIYYSFVYNPKFENMVGVTGMYNFFEFVGILVFSMSCSGVVILIENNMESPRKFGLVLSIGKFYSFNNNNNIVWTNYTN